MVPSLIASLRQWEGGSEADASMTANVCDVGEFIRLFYNEKSVFMF